MHPILPVHSPFFKRKDFNAVLSCLVSGNTRRGTEYKELKSLLLKYTGYAQGCLLREHLRAVELAIKALEIGAGDRVALSPLSSIAYRIALESISAQPVYIDSLPNSSIMNINQIENSHNTAPIKAVILDHPIGQIPDTDQLSRLKRLNISIIQDISEIVESKRNYIGNIVIMNLEDSNVLSLGGGTLLASKPRSPALNTAVEGYPETLYISDVSASLGKAQLQSLESAVERIHEIRNSIVEAVHGSRFRHSIVTMSDVHAVANSLAVILKSPMNEVIFYAAKQGIEAIPAFRGSIVCAMLHNQDFRAKNSQGASSTSTQSTIVPADINPAESFPNSASVALQTILLPLRIGLKKADIENICKLLRTLP